MPLADLRSQSVMRTGDSLVDHLNSFELLPRFTAGIWFFSPAASRFHAKYGPDLPIEARLEIAASLEGYGLEGLEAHYPNEINEDNLNLWQQFMRDTGIRLVTVIPLLFTMPTLNSARFPTRILQSATELLRAPRAPLNWRRSWTVIFPWSGRALMAMRIRSA